MNFIFQIAIETIINKIIDMACDKLLSTQEIGYISFICLVFFLVAYIVRFVSSSSTRQKKKAAAKNTKQKKKSKTKLIKTASV